MSEGGPSCHDMNDVDAAQETGKDQAPNRRLATKRPWLVFSGIMAVLSLILVLASAVAYSMVGSPAGTVNLSEGATVYYNSACGDCAMYIQDTLLPSLSAQGVNNVVLKDWTNHMNYREELFQLHQQYGVDPSLRSHLTTFVKAARLVIFEGHVPGTLLGQGLSHNASDVPKLVISVWDDGMAGGSRRNTRYGHTREHPRPIRSRHP